MSNKLIKFLAQNRPLILTVLGIGGMVGTAVMAYKTYPVVRLKLSDKAVEVWDQEGEDRELTKKEVAECYAKALWPTVLLGAASTTMIVLGHSDQVRRTSALATAYCLSETTLKEYQEKVIEEIGEKKEQAIRDKVSASKMNKVEPTKETIITTSESNPWIFDTSTHCYFRMNYEKFRRVIAEINLEMFKRDFVSVADLYEKLDVKLPPDEDWYLLGWNASNGDIEYYTTSALREIMGETV